MLFITFQELHEISTGFCLMIIHVYRLILKVLVFNLGNGILVRLKNDVNSYLQLRYGFRHVKYTYIILNLIQSFVVALFNVTLKWLVNPPNILRGPFVVKVCLNVR